MVMIITTTKEMMIIMMMKMWAVATEKYHAFEQKDRWTDKEKDRIAQTQRYLDANNRCWKYANKIL
jgi:hypothetical protein